RENVRPFRALRKIAPLQPDRIAPMCDAVTRRLSVGGLARAGELTRTPGGMVGSPRGPHRRPPVRTTLTMPCPVRFASRVTISRHTFRARGLVSSSDIYA